jgi:hypothetical protein
MTKRFQNCALAFGAAIMVASTSAIAGEIKGPPPASNLPPAPRLSNGNSFCSFSGLNDTPLGIPGLDPGGQVQSYGYFMSQFGIFDPSDPDERASFNFPGTGCNPRKVGGLHG